MEKILLLTQDRVLLATGIDPFSLQGANGFVGATPRGCPSRAGAGACAYAKFRPFLKKHKEIQWNWTLMVACTSLYRAVFP